MYTDAVTMDDQTLVALYKKFQEVRHSIGPLYPPALYDDFIQRVRYKGIALPVTMVAQEQLLQATNIINRFANDLHSVTAWSAMFETISEAEKWQALVEFVFLLVSHCLSAPYSIKQMFIKTIYEVSYHTSRFSPVMPSVSPFKPKPRFPDAQNLAKHFCSWPALCKALSVLNNNNLVTVSDNYRNRLNHGFPPRIEVGQ